jgi:hypothetical protein
MASRGLIVSIPPLAASDLIRFVRSGLPSFSHPDFSVNDRGHSYEPQRL